ncbi:hypothetical protein [Lysinibacter cavernae]|uniref:Uncharacterized protein n=2 Tax=Lysinibacter cavernae TaxID=1640652 RepID=A0A7X5TS52_9MICO|nr:hypothetical protein [Lysinibacter cavernae]
MLTFQHRQAVGMGGSKTRPQVAEGLTACLMCNDRFEGDLQETALLFGWKVRRNIGHFVCEDVPVFFPLWAQWFVVVGEIRVPITELEARRKMIAVYGPEYEAWRKGNEQ